MRVEALVFDTYGTLVDWRASVRDELAAFGRARGLAHDWDGFLAEWKAGYRPGMDAVNATLLGPLSLEATRQDLDARGAAQIKANSVNKA